MSDLAERATGEEGRGSGDPLWDDWDTPLRVPSSPELHLEGFDGPLDLLLDLAERQRFDLGRISVLQLAEQFVAAMDRFIGRVSLERRADWLVTASRLVLLRSRLCFAASPEAKADAEKDARREIVRLDQLRFIRAAAAWLEAQPQVGRDVFVRPHGPNARTSSYMDLMEACLTVLLREEEEKAAETPLLGPFMDGAGNHVSHSRRPDRYAGEAWDAAGAGRSAKLHASRVGHRQRQEACCSAGAEQHVDCSVGAIATRRGRAGPGTPAPSSPYRSHVCSNKDVSRRSSLVGRDHQ